jgi:hypothetical protein
MIMIWTYENMGLSHLKVHNFFLVNFFSAIFSHIYILFVLTYHILDPIIYPKKNSYTKMHVYRGINNKLVYIFQLQKSNTIYLVYICCNFLL